VKKEKKQQLGRRKRGIRRRDPATSAIQDPFLTVQGFATKNPSATKGEKKRQKRGGILRRKTLSRPTSRTVHKAFQRPRQRRRHRNLLRGSKKADVKNLAKAKEKG